MQPEFEVVLGNEDDITIRNVEQPLAVDFEGFSVRFRRCSCRMHVQTRRFVALLSFCSPLFVSASLGVSIASTALIAVSVEPLILATDKWRSSMF